MSDHLELDAALTIVARYPLRAGPLGFAPFGAIEHDRLSFERIEPDPNAVEVGRVVILREGTTPWRREVAFDSPIQVIETCDSF